MVPYGRIGRDFIDQVTSDIDEWNACSENQQAAFVLLAVALQKPSAKSKRKDHQEALSKRLAPWKTGEIGKLQINSALRFFSETSTGGVLDLTDDVMDQPKYQSIPIHNL